MRLVRKWNGLRLWVLFICLLVLAGCGGAGDGNAEATEVPPTPPPGTPPPETRSIDLSDVVWTTSIDEETGEPNDEVDSFPADSPTIIAAVEVSQIPTGTMFTATWQIDGDDVPEAEMSVTAEQDLERGWVSFQFIRGGDQYFPLGRLVVNVEASDGTSVTGEVTIVLP